MFFPSRARLASWHPPMQRRRNLENSAVPTLLARGSRLAFRATMCRAEGDLEACWNRILTIFDPYTFSHSQGQGLTFIPASPCGISCPHHPRFLRSFRGEMALTLCANNGPEQVQQGAYPRKLLNHLIGVAS